MSCPWCGAEDHRGDRHGGLGRKLYWWEEEYPFRVPSETWGSERSITLTADEVRRAEVRAQKVIEMDIERGYQMVHEPPKGETRLGVNIRGFAGEIAASRATGLKLNWGYLPKGYRRKNKPPDIGQRVEVRSVRAKSGLLPARMTDPKSRVFMAMQGMVPTFVVGGWIEGVDLMVPEYWHEPTPDRSGVWLIPICDLNRLPLPDDA